MGLLVIRASPRALAALIFAVGALSSGCRGRIDEDRGPLLVSDSFDAAFVWTADGSEIVFVASVRGSGVRTLNAVRIADGSVRQLDSATPAEFTPLARSRDGSALFYFTNDGALREAFSGRNIVPAQPAFLTALAAFPDGSLVVYWDQAANTALLVDVARGTSAPLASCGSAWFAFSPSGGELLCAAASAPALPAAVEKFAVIDVVTRLVRQQVDALVSPASVQWASDSLQLAGALSGDVGAVAVNDLEAGNARVVYRLSPPSSGAVATEKDFPRGNAVSANSFSADGHDLTVWSVECRGTNFAEPQYCGIAQGLLVLIDLETGSQRTIASGEATFDGGGGIGPVAFSDDGTRIAYQFGSEIHLRPTGR